MDSFAYFKMRVKPHHAQKFNLKPLSLLSLELSLFPEDYFKSLYVSYFCFYTMSKTVFCVGILSSSGLVIARSMRDYPL